MKIHLAQAEKIAAQELRRLVTDSPQLGQYEFGEPYLRREEPSFWTFGMASQQLMDEGYAPGALFVSIGKQDGHIWSDEEVTQYYEQLSAVRRQQAA